MPPITIRIPTQAEQMAMYNDPNTLLNQFTAAHTPKPAVGSPSAVTAAGANPLGGPVSNLNNLSNPDWIKAMSEMISQINIDAQQKANAARIPNATGLEAKSSEDIGAALRDELPADVVTQLGQRAAERGVYSGSPMGANSTANLMRSLGLTSLDLQNQGQGWLTAALGRNPGATTANTQALVTTPAQAEALALQRQNMELDYLARMAAINAANQRTRAGYGGGGGGGYPRGGGGGGSFAPATNWQGGPTTPIAGPWHDPGMNTGGGISDEEWNQMLYGLYDTGPTSGGIVNENFNTAPLSPDYTPYNFDVSPLYPDAINTSGMSQDELDWLYNVGG